MRHHPVGSGRQRGASTPARSGPAGIGTGADPGWSFPPVGPRLPAPIPPPPECATPVSRLQPRHIVFATVLLLVAATLFRLGLVELRGEEPRRAVVALEMLDSGEFVVPHLSGNPYFNKPPTFNWAVALSLRIFPGTEAWMVRLPSLVAYWLIGLMTWLVTARLVDGRTALWSMLFYLTSGELLFYGTVMTGELDLFFSLIVFLQAASICWFLLRERWLALFAVSYAFAAIGFLTKGMPSVAFQGLTLVAALAGFGRARRLFDWRHLAGIAVFCALTGAYFLAYAQREPVQPFLVSLFEEASQRTGLQSPIGDLLRGSVAFPLVVLQLLLPWSLLIVWLRGRGIWSALWRNPWTRFCLLFCAANMPLYWFSGELRDRYIYPFFPFVLVPIAFAYARQAQEHAGLRRWTDRAAGAVLASLVVAALVVPWVEPFSRCAHIRTVGLAWAAVSIGVFELHRRRAELRVPVFALALVVARLAFDMAWLPAMNLSRVSAYPPHVESMIAAAGGQPVRLGGPPELVVRRASIGPVKLGVTEYEIPPSIAYQIPWHYARITGKPMIWVAEPRDGDIVLIDRARVGDHAGATLAEFHDHWTGADLVVVRWVRATD